jgi:hypothetical protein
MAHGTLAGILARKQRLEGSRTAAPPDSAMEIFTSPALTVAATAEKVANGPPI